MSEENETDTFISVDIELSRVAINCSVCECAGWKGRVVVEVVGGRVGGAEIHFPIFILVKYSFSLPQSSFLQRC